MRSLKSLLLLLAACMFVAAGLVAQTFRGGIAGTVLDASGAAVPNAAVKAVNKGTDLTRELTTTAAGDFNIPDLPTGIYTVSVSHEGFQTQTVDVEVAVGRISNIPFTLSVASQAQAVEVSAAAVQLETSQTALNSVVSTRAVQDIPLNGRDFRQLLFVSPGFNQANSMNGARPNQNNWQIDGVDNNDFWHNSEAVNQGSISGVAGVLLPIDAIDQFNMQAAGGADFGRNPGSMVNVVVKSGTNDFHGTAYYFHRNDYLAATTPFASPGSPTKLRNHNFGGSIGGPIKRDKAFFFLTYEGQRFLAGNSLVSTFPSNAWISQAETEMAKFNVPVNPAMVNLLTLATNKGANAPATSPNFFSTDNNHYKSDNFVGRIDYSFTPTENLFLRAFDGTGTAAAYAGGLPISEYFQTVPSRQHNYSVIMNSVITPRLVNQVLAGVNYFFQAFDDTANAANPVALGFNTGVTSSNFGTPSVSILGFGDSSGLVMGVTPRLGRQDTTGHLTDNLSYTVGPHALKFGAEYRLSRLDVFYDREARGSFTFTGTAGPWAGDTSVPQQVRSMADYLAGILGPDRAEISVGEPQRVYDVNTFSWWVQDNWQKSPRLNISLGLRWDYNGPLHSLKNDISTFLPSDTAQGGFAFPGAAGSPISSLYPKDFHNFGPRVGFAFTPTRGGKTVIRGSYGIYYDIINGNLFIDNRAGSSAGRGISRNPAGPNAVYVVDVGDFTIIPGQPIFGGGTPVPPFAAYAVNQNLTAPYVQNYNLNVQRQLTSNFIFQIGYVGSQSRHLALNRNINQPLPDPTGLLTEQERRPYNGVYPNLKGITELSSSGDSQYNSMQMSLRSTSYHGFSGQIGYTLAHARDDMSSVRNNQPTDSNNVRLDYGNSDFDVRHVINGFLIWDIPGGSRMPKLTKGWQITLRGSYESGFPYTVLDSSSNASGTFNFKDRANIYGDPFSGIVQPSQPAPGNLSSGFRFFNVCSSTQTTNCFGPATPGTFGNTKRNQFYGPNFRDVDFSVFKTTPITERLKVQLRIEIFNLFNSLNLGDTMFGGLDNDVADGSTAGLISGTRHSGDAPGIGFGEPINAQIALKLIF